MTRRNNRALTETVVQHMQADARETGRSQSESFDGIRVKVNMPSLFTGYKLQYSSPETGAQREYTLGNASNCSVRQAKAKAIEVKAVVASGVDPLEQRKRDKVEKQRLVVQAKDDTIMAAVAYYLNKRKFAGQHGRKQQAILENQFARVLGADRPIASVTKADIRLVLSRLDDTPAARRNLWKSISPMFKYLVHDDLVPTNILHDVLPPSTVASRDRVLNDKEIKLFWSSCDSKVFGPLFRTLLLTGQRLNEVAGLPYSELDLDNSLWTLPTERAKNSKEHFVPLAPQVVTSLNSARKYHGSKFVFTTTGRSPVSGFSKAKASLDRRMKAANGGEAIPPWRLHDLRRTAATAMSLINPDVVTVERVLNHTIKNIGSATAPIYQRAQHLRTSRDLLFQYASKLEGFLDGREDRLIDEDLNMGLPDNEEPESLLSGNLV